MAENPQFINPQEQNIPQVITDPGLGETPLEPGVARMVGSNTQLAGETTVKISGIVPSNATSPEILDKIEESMGEDHHVWKSSRKKTATIIGAGVVTLLTGAAAIAGYELVAKDRFKSKEAYDNFKKSAERIRVATVREADTDKFNAIRKAIKRRRKQKKRS